MEKIKALTDVGNAERFIGQHKNFLRYCPQLNKWFYWTGIRWEIDTAGQIFQKAKETAKAIETEISKTKEQKLRNKIIEHCRRSQSWPRIKAMIKLTESNPEMQVDLSTLDFDPMWLNCTNGTVNLKTGALLAHSKDHYITKSTKTVYNKEAKCPRWLSFLDKIMGSNESLINYLRLIVGYALTGLTKEQCLFIFNGFGANGKSTFFEIIRKVMGDYAMHTPPTTLLKNNSGIRNDLARLKGARFVSAVETGIGNKLNEPLAKELTGGDLITSRFLFREYFEQSPTFKLFIATNCKPEIQGTDHGIWRRIRLIPFDVVLKDEEIDRDLPKKLEAELPGILNWAVP
jgi:putative DNA primase/helicase